MPYVPRRTASTVIREGLDHPVVDCDGHLREFLPEWLDYMVRVGGKEWADRYLKKVGADLAESKPVGLGPNRDFVEAALYTLEERQRGRIRRGHGGACRSRAQSIVRRPICLPSCTAGWRSSEWTTSSPIPLGG